jgi:hypothetical protein
MSPMPRSMGQRADPPTTPPKPTARAQADQGRELAAQGVSKVEIAQRLGMGRASIAPSQAANLGARMAEGQGVKCTTAMYHVVQETSSKSLILLSGWGTRIRT